MAHNEHDVALLLPDAIVIMLDIGPHQEGFHERMRHQMLQVITGPSGQIAYLDTRTHPNAHYPALNLPCRAFVKGLGVQAANLTSTPDATPFPRRARRGAALAMFGEPIKRGR